MISASKSALRPKVTKKFTNLVKKLCESPPRSLTWKEGRPDSIKVIF